MKLTIRSLFSIFLLFSSFYSKGTTYYSIVSNGNWSSGSTWSTTGPAGPSCSCVPPSNGNGDIIIIEPGDTITNSGSYTLGNNCSLTVSSGAVLNITGLLTMGNGATLTDNGSFTSGGLTFGNNATINVGTGAVFIVNGNLTAGNGASATINGTVTVNGNATLGNNATISGTGTVTTTGTFSTGNGGSIFGGGGGSCTDCTLSNGSGLPIELISFTGAYNNDNVLLAWSSATEINNKYYTIERTTDGVHYTVVANINGAGNSSRQINYSASDPSPSKGVNYYRLSQTDFDGNTAFLGEIPVTVDIVVSGLIVFPNPTQNNCIVSFEDSKIEPTVLNVFDFLGKQIRSIPIQTVIGINSVELDVSTFSQGLYFIQLPSNQHLMNTKFIKN